MNPFLKTFLMQLGGVAAAGVVTAIDHPTGGLATTLTTHPEIGVAYVAVSQLLHNIVSHYFPSDGPAAAPAK